SCASPPVRIASGTSKRLASGPPWMRLPRAELVVAGEVVVRAGRGGLEVREAIGVTGGRVVACGRLDDVRSAAVSGARFVDARGRAVIPGLHDAHVHLVDLARSRRSLDLAAARTYADVERLTDRACGELPPGAWLLGRGWSADSLPAGRARDLGELIGDRPAFLRSRDGHSAWASEPVLERAGVGASTPDPPGGRIERAPDGTPTGLVREKAVDLVTPVVDLLEGAALAAALDETLSELRSLGLTGVTDAGDFTADRGRGRWAALGDSFSALADATPQLRGRMRVNANVPRAALDAATSFGLETGAAVDDGGVLRCGWIKLFSDGALGSRTAALFEPYSCAERDDDVGVLTTSQTELDTVIAAGRRARLGVAVHAIGDRANAAVLDGFERAGPGTTDRGVRDRIEHAQLTRAVDRARIADLGVVASMQPAHCPSDAAAIDRCWTGREADAYAWRSLADAGATLAFGSDAPVEPVNPWVGIHAAVRRTPAGRVDAWHPEQTLSFAEALAAYTVGPAVAMGLTDEGHLEVGAQADVAILDRSIAAIAACADDVVDVRAELTFIAGEEVPR
ncbi:MAG: amidohydrolase, partial [Chloroflexota bacterium]|nr:amidohydrolase [Chloroflexota bacterium]